MNTLCKVSPVVMKSSVTQSNKVNKITPKQILKNLQFNSWAPEVINGRCAMLGFVSGQGYELITNQTVLNQPHALEAFAVTSGLIAIASLIAGDPYDYTDTKKPFIPSVEMLNGRIAMMGIMLYLLN